MIRREKQLRALFDCLSPAQSQKITLIIVTAVLFFFSFKKKKSAAAQSPPPSEFTTNVCIQTNLIFQQQQGKIKETRRDG